MTVQSSATQAELRRKCGQCGHTFSFHGRQDDAPCHAMGCKGGADGHRCSAFVSRDLAMDPIFLAPFGLSA